MSSSSRTIVLQSDDGETFEVEQSVVQLSQLIRLHIEEDSTKTIIPIPNVSGDILSMVIDYCRNHVKPHDSFDTKFIDDVDIATLLDLADAARFLDIKSLVGLSCQVVADRIKYKTVEEIREIFDIEHVFTPEEEELCCEYVCPFG